MSEKGKKLRPLRIFMAILTIALFILIFRYFPIKKVYTKTTAKISENSSEVTSTELSEGGYYYFSGLLDYLEDNLQERLEKLGVPEEEFENPSEYLSKDELFEVETKATLASSLDDSWVFAEPDDLVKIKSIFNLDEDYYVQSYKKDDSPSEYKNLYELIEEYKRTLTTTEDYDENYGIISI